MFESLLHHYNYWMFIGLMMIGFYAMMAKKNLIKKIIGMNIFQSAIILFFISTSVKGGGVTVPILEHPEGAQGGFVDVMKYANPLPHVLMLTAIVVMVATLGVALAVVMMIYKRYHTLEEDEIALIRRKQGLKC
ncbi:MAG: cation:proton antiporter subunit C [Deltaproteobacteria bacterium]|nr:cation:proton antiporter subunit C [Deltaproteobacteria bacterium]MBW2049046.1 cation:proton antiporter subunit C [Deltaproteobacteria bacterium]MBW2111006.1 cation:proton antiporter subunit C [Deltaproteobacteria bacterium]MBW2353177.1 cation:proton antiporter subunit C [Deltaproteobacteria bacterium]HDZ89235.1 NADH-quinone oxidoreductase subunit J [Deltaproteobacteria bacterium]